MLSYEMTGIVMTVINKRNIKDMIKLLLSHKMAEGVILFLIMVLTIKLIDLFFIPLLKKNSITMGFFKGIMQVFVAIFFMFQIASLSETLTKFYSSILMSSSLIVVVLGFVFQEGLSNMVHGFILILFQPFKIGDRVKVTVDGKEISGYIKAITLRNTVIQDVLNTSSVIVPNAKMDLCIIDNSYFDDNVAKSNLVDVTVTYESDLDKAIEILREIVDSHPLVAQTKEHFSLPPANVMVSALNDSSILLRVSVPTMTIEENFSACSDIRRAIVIRFQVDPEVDIAYPHLVVMEK